MRLTAALISTALFVAPAPAQNARFHAGAAIPGFGRIADVDADFRIPAGTKFKLVFDGSAEADAGKVNRVLDSAARFINMHIAAGVPARDIQVAVVLHGRAANDLLRPEVYARKHSDRANATAPLIAALVANNVEIVLCGQTAAALEIERTDLLPGVKMALSAMTAHALFQQQGYTLNPF